jgi:hypothetical protein
LRFDSPGQAKPSPGTPAAELLVNPQISSIVDTAYSLPGITMRFNGLTKGFFIFILAHVTWAIFDVLSH